MDLLKALGGAYVSFGHLSSLIYRLSHSKILFTRFNVAESVFGKLKCLLHNESYQSICRDNMEQAIFTSLGIRVSEIRGFFQKVGHLNI